MPSGTLAGVRRVTLPRTLIRPYRPHQSHPQPRRTHGRAQEAGHKPWHPLQPSRQRRRGPGGRRQARQRRPQEVVSTPDFATSLHAELVERILADPWWGDRTLEDPVWRAAFNAGPRHRFAPDTWYEWNGDGTWTTRHRADDEDAWARAVY